jgi:hypothetical protein
MCEKRIANLKRLTLKLPRPVQTVTPERAIPLQQPPSEALDLSHNHHGKISNKVFKKANTLPKVFMTDLALAIWNTFFLEQYIIIWVIKEFTVITSRVLTI